MNVGSLFSGIGGIELGLERAGDFNTLWFIENDKHAQTILKKHWPSAIIYDDITTIDFKSIPRVDVLTGGFPCQDISNAGKRAGISGSRSSLWKHYLRAIRVLRPKYIIAENVAALINRGLDTVLSDLAAVGYDAEWHCISASSVGAPHRRDRVFIIGIRTDDVAYSECEREMSILGQESIERENKECCCAESSCTSNDVADTTCIGWSWWESNHYFYQKQQVLFTKNQEWHSFWCEIERECNALSNTNHINDRIERESRVREENWRETWKSEPDVGRVVNGLSFRMDRIKRLGNAVVPRVAQVIGEAIQKREDTKARDCVGE